MTSYTLYYYNSRAFSGAYEGSSPQDRKALLVFTALLAIIWPVLNLSSITESVGLGLTVGMCMMLYILCVCMLLYIRVCGYRYPRIHLYVCTAPYTCRINAYTCHICIYISYMCMYMYAYICYTILLFTRILYSKITPHLCIVYYMYLTICTILHHTHIHLIHYTYYYIILQVYPSSSATYSYQVLVI